MTTPPLSPATVVVERDGGRTKFELLDAVLDRGGFVEALDEARVRSGKPPEAVRVVVKPNLSMLARKADDGVYTDPTLVVHLIRRIMERGYANVAVVDAQNLYANWFGGREVPRVAARAGYLEPEVLATFRPGREYRGWVWTDRGEQSYRVADLTAEPIDHDYGPPLGVRKVGRTWAEADFRISFAKHKTHFFGRFTLGVKNTYGCLPEQDKMLHYHSRGLTGSATAAQLRAFPVDFALVDAYTSADGLLGVKMKAVSKKTRVLYGGRSLLAVDAVGARLMGLDPMENHFFRGAARALGGVPEIRVLGDDSRLPGWKNSPRWAYGASATADRPYAFGHLMGHLYTSELDDCFPDRSSPWKIRALRALFLLPYPVMTATNAGQLRRILAAWSSRRLARRRRLPLSSVDPRFLEAVRELPPPLLERVESILVSAPPGGTKVRRYGHLVRFGTRVEAFPTTTPFGAEAAATLLDGVATGRWRREEVLREVKAWLDIHEAATRPDRVPALFFSVQNS